MNKGIPENISSGFGSGHDAADSDFDLVNMMTNTSNNLQNTKQNLNFSHQTSNIVFPFVDNLNCISPNIKSFKNENSTENNENEPKIDEISKNYSSLLWDLDQTFNLNDLENIPKLDHNNDVFNLDDMLNISELQNGNQHLFQKSIFEDQVLNPQFDKIDFNNPENFLFQQADPFLNQTQIELNGIQTLLADPANRISTEGLVPQTIEDPCNK